MTTIDLIKSTKAYQAFGKSTQIHLTSVQNIEFIRQALELKGVFSFDQWKETTSSGKANLAIVKELFLLVDDIVFFDGKHLSQSKVTKGTAKKMNFFIWHHRNEMSVENLSKWRLLHDMINSESNKKASARASIRELIGRCANLDSIIIQSGAMSVEHEFISL